MWAHQNGHIKTPIREIIPRFKLESSLVLAGLQSELSDYPKPQCKTKV